MLFASQGNWMARQVPRPGSSLFSIFFSSLGISLSCVTIGMHGTGYGQGPGRGVQKFSLYISIRQTNKIMMGKKFGQKCGQKNASTITEVENLTNNYSTRTCWI